MVGQLLDHFELEALVGRGGMGTVYRARDTRLGRTVAVKVLSSDSGCDEELLARFKNEAQSAARLEHENVARVFHVGECGGVHYIVYEFIEGTNIRDLVDTEGPLPISDAVNYTLQIAETLAHAFERDVVHRDIKPSNIIVTASGQAKLVDLGLARLHQVEQSGDDLTASGVTLGTFDYISPEQAGDPRSADVRSDL
jgi:serine/threonine-protein kinase